MAQQDPAKHPKYIFNRDFRSSIRLNYNHWLLKEICGYLLHPHIPKPSGAARVADVGAGTGIWLQETAATLPTSVRFDGFDISPDQFPPQAWWQPNIHFQVQDAFKPFPAEHLGQYDIVHARFFLCLVNDADAAPLLENLVSLLKPGGYLQWFEPDANAAKMVSFNPAAASTAAVEQLAQSFRKPRPDSSYNWIVEMPLLFAKNNLTLEVRSEHPFKDYLRLPWAQSLLAGLEDLVANSAVTGSSQGEEVAQHINGLKSEFRHGVALDVPWICFVGRKT